MGENIRAKREALKMTQQTLADACRVTRSVVARWESGGFAPQADKLPLLAKALGCTIDDLFKED